MIASPKPSVAVLGAGITGAATALFLARAGCAVTLVDRGPAPISAASRWNEGKIHLGFLYAGDPSGRTASKLIEGGLAFESIMEELIGRSIAPAVTQGGDIYILHPSSVVSAEALAAYLGKVTAMIRDHSAGDRASGMPGVERLPGEVVSSMTGAVSEIGFRVPERSVNTQWIADRIVEAVADEPNIAFVGDTTVMEAQPSDGDWAGLWTLKCNPPIDAQFDVVVNALWEGRPAVDAKLGVMLASGWSHRFRLALFVRTTQAIELPNAVLVTGPFGDMKNYDGRNFYLSWYPAGMVAEGDGVEPPRLPKDIALPKVIAETKAGLAAILPAVNEVFDAAESVEVRGGWVFAAGKGSLSDPASSLHRRDKFGITSKGAYFSVDTGKYSMGPLLAREVANRILGL